MRAAMRVEALKLTHSLVGLIATLAVVAGMLALLGGITAGVAGGNPELVAKAGPAGTLNWDGLLAGAAQITAVASILGFGIVLSWMFGREFTEGTVTGLFALPVSRTRIALAKLTVYALWATVVSVALTAEASGKPLSDSSATIAASLPPRPPGRKESAPTSIAKA